MKKIFKSNFNWNPHLIVKKRFNLIFSLNNKSTCKVLSYWEKHKFEECKIIWERPGHFTLFNYSQQSYDFNKVYMLTLQVSVKAIWATLWAYTIPGFLVTKNTSQIPQLQPKLPSSHHPSQVFLNCTTSFMQKSTRKRSDAPQQAVKSLT